jgi:hypothetical protein
VACLLDSGNTDRRFGRQPGALVRPERTPAIACEASVAGVLLFAPSGTHGCDPVNAVEWAGQTEKATAGREPSVRTSPGKHRLTSDALRPARAGLRLFWTHRSRSRLSSRPSGLRRGRCRASRWLLHNPLERGFGGRQSLDPRRAKGAVPSYGPCDRVCGALSQRHRIMQQPPRVAALSVWPPFHRRAKSWPASCRLASCLDSSASPRSCWDSLCGRPLRSLPCSRCEAAGGHGILTRY